MLAVLWTNAVSDSAEGVKKSWTTQLFVHQFAEAVIVMESHGWPAAAGTGARAAFSGLLGYVCREEQNRTLAV